MEESKEPRKRAKRQDNTGAYWHVPREGRWRAQFHDAAGRLRYLSARSEQEIVNKLDRAISERDHGTLGLAPNETPTLGEWMETWLESKYQLKRKTVIRYQTDIDLYIKPALGNVRVDQVKASMVEAMYGRLANERGLSPASIKHVHATLSAALNTAYRHDVVPTQVMARVSPPRVPVKRRKTLNGASVLKFLEAADKRGLRCSLRWRLALLWGIRQGEALGLRWRDLDLVEGRVSISQQRQYFSGEGMVEESLKSSSSSRVHPGRVSAPAGAVRAAEPHQRAVLPEARQGPSREIPGGRSRGEPALRHGSRSFGRVATSEHVTGSEAA